MRRLGPLVFLSLVLLGCDSGKPKLEPAASAKLTPAELVEPAQVPKDTWMEFSSESSAFKARFPAAPKLEKFSMPSAVGDVASEMFASQLGDAFLAVNVSTMPAALEESDFDMNASLDGARNGAVNNVQGTLLSEKSIKWLGFDAREFEAKATQEGIEMRLVARIFIKWPHLYQTVVVYPTSAAAPPAQRFFEGFALLP